MGLHISPGKDGKTPSSVLAREAKAQMVNGIKVQVPDSC